MKLKILLFACAIALIPISYQLYITAKPPFLKHDNNSCWNDSAVWLLYNIPELVDELIENKISYEKENNFDVLFLADLLEAMRNQEKADDENKNNKTKKELDKTIKDAQKMFHQNVACPLTETTHGDFGDAGLLFTTIIKKIPFYKDIISGYVSFSGSRTLTSKKTDIYKEYYNDKENILSINAPEKYLYLQSAHYAFDKDKKIETVLTFTEVDDDGKPTGNKHRYEFIGMILGGGGHATAYIKNQREKGNPWYYCNDMGGTIKKADTKDFPLPLNWKNVNFEKETHPLILLYKKLPDIKDVDNFAQALNDIATK